MNAFTRIALTLVILAAGNVAPTLAAPLILNEFNAVSGSNFLNFGTATTDGDADRILLTGYDVPPLNVMRDGVQAVAGDGRRGAVRDEHPGFLNQ